MKPRAKLSAKPRARRCSAAGFFRGFADDRAQATAEYILMLSVAVAMALLVIKTFIVPLTTRLSNMITNAMKGVLFNERSMHQIFIPR